MKKHLVRVLLLLAVSLLFASAVHAEVKFDYGAAERLRWELWDNTVTLNTLSRSTSGADRAFFRFRTTLWGKADLTNDLGIYLRLANEAKYYTGPFKPNTPRNNNKFDEDELVIDNMYVDVKNLFGAVDLRIGRQDFIGTYGEGFLIMDGNPGDGSRTFYFNAARANVKVSPNFNFDLTYISDPKTDIYLPNLHTGTKKQLTGSDEQAFVFYGRGKIANLAVEPYYIYKTEDPVGTNPKLKLNTIGARAVYSVDSWKVGGEYAHQFGEYDGGRDRTGNGGYIFVSRKYEQTTWKPEFDLRFVYLSGDDPGSSKNETWDPLFSRNPNWNELMIYTFIVETANNGGPIPGYWTNLELLRAAVKLNFTPATNLTLSYQYLWAPEHTSGLPTAMFSNSGKNRGHLPTALLTHKFTKNIDALLLFEYLIPGNFYADGADNAIFARAQFQVKF